MSGDSNRSVGPGQWAPWISDPDPPEEPMTDEQSKAAARATRDLVPVVPASPSSRQKTPDEMHEAVIVNLMNRKGFTREEAEEAVENFY